MNIEIANRLLQYRKRMGLSQEELAEKIGVSRQAVSKWERAEAAPDTDNLIELSKIYGVSLDEMLKGRPEARLTSTETVYLLKKTASKRSIPVPTVIFIKALISLKKKTSINGAAFGSSCRTLSSQ